MVRLQKPQLGRQARFLPNVAAVTLLASSIPHSEENFLFGSFSDINTLKYSTWLNPGELTLNGNGKNHFLSKGVWQTLRICSTPISDESESSRNYKYFKNHWCQYYPYPWNINMYTHPRTPLELYLFHNSQVGKGPFLNLFLGTWGASSKIVILPNAFPYALNTPIKVSFLSPQTFSTSQ